MIGRYGMRIEYTDREGMGDGRVMLMWLYDWMYVVMVGYWGKRGS